MDLLKSGSFAILPLLLFLVAGMPGRAVSIGGGGGLTVTVTPNGAYSVAVPVPAWRFDGNIGASLANLSVHSGVDAVGGVYSEVSFEFFSDAQRHASIRSYSGSCAVLFSMSLPDGGPNTLAFPTWTRHPAGLSHIAFAGQFAYPTFFGLSEESPWVYFDSALNTVILSPVAHFMVASTGTSHTANWPAGFPRKSPRCPRALPTRRCC